MTLAVGLVDGRVEGRLRIDEDTQFRRNPGPHVRVAAEIRKALRGDAPRHHAY